MAVETKPQPLELVDEEEQQSAAPLWAAPEDGPYWDASPELPDGPPENIEPDPETGKSWLWRQPDVNGVFSAAVNKVAFYLGRWQARQKDVARIREHYAALREPFEAEAARLKEREEQAIKAHTQPLKWIRMCVSWLYQDFGDQIADAIGKKKRFPVGPGSVQLKEATERKLWHDVAALAWAQEHFAGDFAAQEKYLDNKPRIQKKPLKADVVWEGGKPFFNDEKSGQLVPMEIALSDGTQPPAMYIEPVPEEVIIIVDADTGTK